MREMEESIDKDIRAQASASAKTGVGIGVAPAEGPNIGKTPKTGDGNRSRRAHGPGCRDVPEKQFGHRGSGPTGFAIGATGRAGSSIGESTLNNDTSSSVDSSLQRSTVGSSISDSSVGSSMGPSSVGSSLQDSSVGSSFGARRLALPCKTEQQARSDKALLLQPSAPRGLCGNHRRHRLPRLACILAAIQSAPIRPKIKQFRIGGALREGADV